MAVLDVQFLLRLMAVPVVDALLCTPLVLAVHAAGAVGVLAPVLLCMMAVLTVDPSVFLRRGLCKPTPSFRLPLSPAPLLPLPPPPPQAGR